MFKSICPRSLLRTTLKQSEASSISSRRWLSTTGTAAQVNSGDDDILRHVHFNGTVSYDEAQRVHERYHDEFISWKRATVEKSKRGEALDGTNEPKPVVLTFEAEPTYTLGRRQDEMGVENKGVLTDELEVYLKRGNGKLLDFTQKPVIRSTMRGGLTTYHGPGQLVIWPILDMRSLTYNNFSVSSYASTLENTTRSLLLTNFGIKSITTPDAPGVWVPDQDGNPRAKISALGVHHRRHITGLGMSLNVDVPTSGQEKRNPWGRFDPCGLRDTPGVTSEVTSLASEVGREGEEWDTGRIAFEWVRIFRLALLKKA